MSLSIQDVVFSYGDHRVLTGVSLDSVQPGELTVVLGVNAAGKSTLFQCLAGMRKIETGRIVLHDQDMSACDPRDWFRRVCYMPQVFTSDAMLTVFEVILLARKHEGGGQVSDADALAVDQLLVEFGIAHLSHRYISQLSGGQQQLVSLCQAMARNPALFLLDEPTSALDLGKQMQVMTRLKQETCARQTITIVAMHDLSLSVRFADKIIVMDQGAVRAFGTVDAVFASTVIADTYGVNIELMRDSQQRCVVSAS